jgi:nicotinate-nucleotide pyrophosphorylase (carboxylating)
LCVQNGFALTVKPFFYFYGMQYTPSPSFPPSAQTLDRFIELALAEDVGPGDVTSLSTIPAHQTARAHCLVKDPGVLAGVAFAVHLFSKLDSHLQMEVALADGAQAEPGQVAFWLEGNARTILTAERLALNVMQRMSGIATLTHQVVQAITGTGCRVLDTRKTTPLFRDFEKWAVKIGGGTNHRYGLFDMVLIKDNHVDAAGGVAPALAAAKRYLAAQALPLKIEVETRNLAEVQAVLTEGGAHRILLDNMTPQQLREAVALVGNQAETEASGGITLQNCRQYAETGVQFISMGALTHSAPCLDISLKLKLNS